MKSTDLGIKILMTMTGHTWDYPIPPIILAIADNYGLSTLIENSYLYYKHDVNRLVSFYSDGIVYVQDIPWDTLWSIARGYANHTTNSAIDRLNISLLFARLRKCHIICRVELSDPESLSILDQYLGTHSD